MKHQLTGKLSRRRFVQNSAIVGGGLVITSVSAQIGRLDLATRRMAAFAKTIEGEVLLASHPGYERSRRVASFNPLTDKRPLLIVRCADTPDVARSIEYARMNELEIAVRSGA